MKKAGISKRSRAGGANLLDDIMRNVTQLHASLPARSRGIAAIDDDEVASPYMISKASTNATMAVAAATSTPGMAALEVCRNAQCGRSEFEVDARRGDRICIHCGVVQNSRSLESHEEEHRTFADDDKSESKKRAEIQRDGQSGGQVSEELKKMQSLAASSGDKVGGLSDKDANRLAKVKQLIGELATRMELSGNNSVVEAAKDATERCVTSVTPMPSSPWIPCSPPTS